MGLQAVPTAADDRRKYDNLVVQYKTALTFLRELLNYTFLRAIYHTSTRQAQTEYKEIQRTFVTKNALKTNPDIFTAMDWLACLSLDPDSEVRRGTLSVLSELRATYSSQQTLQELHFHLHDDKKLLEARICGAMTSGSDSQKSLSSSQAAQSRSDKISPMN
jgi:hypothetical protein